MSQKTYLMLLKIGVYLSLMCVFFVFKGLLFPFITSKQISFNILIEVLFVLWLAFIIKYPVYRPKKSHITFGLIGFFSALVVSCIFSIDFNLSFWGDVERMLGVFHVLHFLAFYFIIITVFREWKDWKILFIISVIYASIVGLNGIFGDKGYSTIGNTAYVSGYMIFNMYFCFLLFFREKNKFWRWAYLSPMIILFFSFKKADTSGAYVGLGASIIVLMFLYAILNKNKKIKIATVILGMILVSIVGYAFTHKDSNFVKNTEFLQPIRGISLQKRTFQTRLISWKAAYLDFKEHPIVGTGHGNFAITFDKHFDPKFYNFTRGETYFDRAHNNVIDIASTSGLLGLLTYLSIFFATAYYLIKGYRKDKINTHEFILVSCVIIAYFVQNLAVFDSLVTYFSLMMVLAYVYWLYEKEDEVEVMRDEELNNKEIYTLAGVGLIIFVIMFQYNIKPYQMLVGTINGQRAYAQGQHEATIDIYREALSKNTVLDRDSRTSLIRLFMSNPNTLLKMDKETREKNLDYLIGLAKENVKYNTGDSLNQMMLAQMLNIGAKINQNNPEKLMYYSDQAIEAINMSIAASPGRIPIYFQKAQLQLDRGEQDKAIETLKYAATLNEDYYDTYCHLSRMYFTKDENETAYTYLDQCIDKGGSKLLTPVNAVKNYSNYYIEKEDWQKVLKLAQRLTALEKKNVKVWINLAKLEAEYGDIDKAIKAAEKAIEVDPSVADYANDFIKSLE